MSVEGYKEEFENLNANPQKLVTFRIPVSLSFYFPFGIFAKTNATYVDQEVTNNTVENENFWVMDMSLGYRLPKRWGIISFGVKNVFDESFNYQDVNFSSREPITPLYQPVRMIFGQVTLSF
jgi:outer membrane receptor protein involved in Fe transport